MKKLIVFVFAAVLAVGFASCDDGKPHCYAITSSGTVLGILVEGTFYVWKTKTEVQALVEEGRKEAGIEKVTYKKVNKSETDCLAANASLLQ